jgi:hypothetical protein
MITVEAVEGTTVQGTFAPEDTLIVGAGAWAVSDFERLTLVQDPDWPTYRVVMVAAYANDTVDQAMQPVGMKDGAQTMALSENGKSRAWWDVVAPTEDDALDRARAAVSHLDALVDLESIHVNANVPDKG